MGIVTQSVSRLSAASVGIHLTVPDVVAVAERAVAVGGNLLIEGSNAGASQ